jgi:DNA-directed RNA polymerase specialized sigma24 family protein
LPRWVTRRPSPPSTGGVRGPLAEFFMRHTGDAELAADLTAETFAAALASRRRFDPAKGAAIG